MIRQYTSLPPILPPSCSIVGVNPDGDSIFDATYSFALTSQPVHAVHMSLSVLDKDTNLPSNLTRLSARSFTFDANNWDVQRSVTVTATSEDAIEVKHYSIYRAPITPDLSVELIFTSFENNDEENILTLQIFI